MILSKNAVGNLINRYKAVLGKCRLINTFGSLALAAALIMGSAGLAAAAEVTPDDPGYWTGAVTITDNVTVNTFFMENDQGQNIEATSITLGNDDSLTLRDGARLINGVPGSDGDAPGRLTFTMTGGTLTLGGTGDSYADTGINASINAKSVNISGGSVNITGKADPSNWYQAAQLGGYRGLTVSGGKINMNSYSQMFGGGTVGAQFTGGTINMLGDTTATEVNNSAAHIMFGGLGDNLIAGTAAINVGSEDDAGYGVITTGTKVNMTGGSINVQNGELLMQPDVNGNTGNTDIIYNGSATGAFNQTGGTVTIADKGKMTLNKGMTYTLGEGGSLALNGGTIELNNGTHMYLKKGTLTETGGKFVVNGSQINGFSHLVFSSENFGKALDKGNLSINGGFVSAGDNATLDAGKFVASASNAGEISFDSVKGGNLYAEAMTITASGIIDTVNMGVLTSDTLAIKSASTTGTVEVNKTTLDLTGKNSTLTVTQDNADAVLTLSQNSSLLIGTDPALYSGPKTATINAAVNVADGMLRVGYNNGSGVTDTAAATFTKGVTVGNDTTKGTLDVTAGSTMTMGAGTTLDFQNATDMTEIAGTLNVTADNSALKIADINGNTLIVASGGRLNATTDSLAIKDAYTSDNIKKQLTVKGGGTLKLGKLAELTLANISTLKTALMTSDSTGLFDVGDAFITGVVATDGTVTYTDASTLENITNNALRAATVTEVNGNLSGAYHGVKLADNGNLNVASGATLQLTGGADNANIVATTGGTVGDLSVANTGTLMLGDADSNNHGSLGNVTLNGTGAFNVVGNGTAAFTAGDITGIAGSVSASGATLNTQTVDVDSLSAVSGTVSATTITAGTLDANNGTVRANGNITASNAATLTNNGVIQSTTGDVTLTNGLANGNGSVQAGGKITAGNNALTAANGEILNLVAGTEIEAASITATKVQAKTLTATGDVTVANGTLTTTGTEATNNGSSITGNLSLTSSQANLGDMTVTGAAAVTGGSLVAGNLVTAGAATIDGSSVTADKITASSVTATGGSLAANSLTVNGNSDFTNGTKVNVGDLNANGKTITVGDANDTKSTSLVAENLTLGGGSLLIDPAWTANGPNTVTLLNAMGANIDGNVGVGQNSMLTIGDTSSTWLAGQVSDVTKGAGLTSSGITAALGLKEAQVLGDDGSGTGYSLVVDGSKDTAALTAALTPTNATFANNSLLVVTAAAAQNAAGALSATTTTSAYIGDSAKLRITDAKVGQKYTVLGDNIAGHITLDTKKTGWTGSNFSTDSRMVKGSFDAASGVLTASLNSSANVYPKLDGELVKVLDNAYTADQVGPAHVNSDVKGVRFLSRATNDNFIGSNANLAAKTIESAARIAVAGAVPQMAMAASNAAGAAITQRTSIAQPDGNGMQSVSLNKGDDVNKKGVALWIMPLYQNQNAWSMEAGNNYDLKWHGGLGGVALGGDYTFDNALRAGIAFNIGGGYAEGEGDLAKTTNSFNFWGLGAYAGWAMQNFGITADVNYTSTYNKVKQELPGAMQMRDLKSDITAYALSSGLRAEYKFNTQYVDIIPHLGVRYMYVNTDSYDVKSGGTVMHGDETSQNIWTFPIGVTFSKQVETGNGWYVKPNLDLGVLPATGDIDAKSKIRFTGTGTKAELDTRTMDYMSYTGGLGLDFGNNNLSFGLNYNIQASEHTTSHGVFGTARYEF